MLAVPADQLHSGVQCLFTNLILQWEDVAHRLCCRTIDEQGLDASLYIGTCCSQRSAAEEQRGIVPDNSLRPEHCCSKHK